MNTGEVIRVEEVSLEELYILLSTTFDAIETSKHEQELRS